MSFQKIPHMETDALPSLCSGKGCLKDCEPGKAYCRSCSDTIKAQHFKKERVVWHKPSIGGNFGPCWLWIYFVEIQDGTGAIKIGFASNLKSRVSQLQTSSPYDLKIRAAFVGKEATEKFLHQKFEDLHLRGEWFSKSDRIDRVIDAIRSGDVPDYFPGVYRQAETGKPEIFKVDKRIGK